MFSVQDDTKVCDVVVRRHKARQHAWEHFPPIVSKLYAKWSQISEINHNHGKCCHPSNSYGQGIVFSSKNERQNKFINLGIESEGLITLQLLDWHDPTQSICKQCERTRQINRCTDDICRQP